MDKNIALTLALLVLATRLQAAVVLAESPEIDWSYRANSLAELLQVSQSTVPILFEDSIKWLKNVVGDLTSEQEENLRRITN